MNKDAVSHYSWPVQSLYTRIQQLDTMSSIKNSYIKSHQKLTLAFPFRDELLGKYGQSDHFNQDKGWPKQKVDDELRFSTTRKGGGGRIVIILITAMCSTTHTGGFNHAGRWLKQRSPRHAERKGEKGPFWGRAWEEKAKGNGETKIKTDATRKNGTQK